MENAKMNKLPDRAAVVESLRRCVFADGMPQCDKCAYDGPNCWERLKADAARLLEAQAQEPISASIVDSDGGLMHWWACGSCQTPINPEDKFCHECGRAVKWE